MYQATDELFIQVLKNAACAAAHRADVAANHDDPKTAHACIDVAYAALDEMFNRQRALQDQFPINDNAAEPQAVEA